MAPRQLMFKHELVMHLNWVHGMRILHVVDTHTQYGNATIFRNKTAGSIWDAFVECWETIFIGVPRVLRLDQEASFTANAFRELATAHGIVLQFSGVASHNSIGVGERYHVPLRRIFLNINHTHRSLHPKYIYIYMLAQHCESPQRHRRPQWPYGDSIRLWVSTFSSSSTKKLTYPGRPDGGPKAITKRSHLNHE